jgi:hypothetical protein
LTVLVLACATPLESLAHSTSTVAIPFTWYVVVVVALIQVARLALEVGELALVAVTASVLTVVTVAVDIPASV